MLTIRCPICDHIGIELSLADWEDYLGVLELGKDTRLSLVCLSCHNEFLLQMALSQVIT